MKILVVLSRFPFPLDKGDKLRAFYQIKELSKQHEICLFCTHVGEAIPTQHIAEVKLHVADLHIHHIPKYRVLWRLFLGIFNKKPFQVSYFHGKSSQAAFDRFLEKHMPDALYCQLIRTAEYARKYALTTKVLDYMDALSLGFERRYSKANWFIKPFLRIEKNRLSTYESQVFGLFEHKTIIAEKDRSHIAHKNTNEIHVIPNGIDKRYFEKTTIEKKYDVLFTGNMSYPPNVEAATFLAKKVMPLVHNSHPKCTLLIAGTSPTRVVRNLKSSLVTVSGWLPDLKTVYDESRVFIAPMFMGSGLQNKLLEAMASGIPSITTTLANQPLGAENGKDIVVADTAEAMAKAIVQFLDDEAAAKAFGENGSQYIATQFQWDKTTNRLEQLLGSKA